MPATSVAALPAPTDAATAARRWAPPLWVGALLIILAFLVIYPLPMLFFGAVSDSSPVMTGMTGLYVTHDQSEAVVLGDRIGVMKDGKLLQMAPPGEIYNRPADSFVANFTGASNVLKGKVLERNGDQAIIDLGAAGRSSARPRATTTGRSPSPCRPTGAGPISTTVRRRWTEARHGAPPRAAYRVRAGGFAVRFSAAWH